MGGNIEVDFKECGWKEWTGYIFPGTVERTVSDESGNKCLVS
jgi:hypothetical protein